MGDIFVLAKVSFSGLIGYKGEKNMSKNKTVRKWFLKTKVLLSVLFMLAGILPAFGACTSSQCYNGSFCENTPTSNGFYVIENEKCSVYRYDKCTCKEGNGWECERIPVSTGAPISYCSGKSECVVGMRKYKASSEGCSTDIMHCCNNNTWSDWHGVCSNGSSQGGGEGEDKECNTFKSTRTYASSRDFGSYSEAVSYAKANDSCNRSELEYSGTCTKAMTCNDLVAKNTPNYNGSWYETGDMLYQYTIDTSDAKTCELYNSYNTKMDPNQACSLKYYGTTYTSTTERTSTCYTNCRLYSSGGYNPQYTCDVNILKCKPVYYVQNYRYECKADCN